MGRDVFISYARSTHRAWAEELYEALGGESGSAFLDTEFIEGGDRFPEKLADALLDARVVVAFVDEAYFRRWYCLWEMRTALAPFLALPIGATDAEKRAELTPLMLALPAAGGAPSEVQRLPPGVRTVNWHRADEVELLATMVRARVDATRETIGDRLARRGRRDATRAELVQESALPPPRNLQGVRLYPLERSPSLGKSFVGRADELWRIDFTLSTLRGETSGAALTGALEGGGGFGKTRLALEYVHRLGPVHFPGGIFWVDADASDERLEEQFHGILKTLRPEVPELVAFREQKRNAAQELSRALHDMSAEKPVLYVVDNVPEAPRGSAPKPLKTWCPAIGKVALLVTSRAKVSLGNEAVHPLQIETLSPDAAVMLLTEGVERARLDEAAWRKIADWVGHLPLSLELLNKAMRAGGLEPRELLAKAESTGPAKELDRQMDALREQVPEGQLRGITEALSVSYEKLSPEAQRLARLLAQLSREPVPVAVLDALGEEVAGRAARNALVARSFVTQVKGEGVPMFGVMHRVLADFLRSQSGDEVEELNTVVKALGAVLEFNACRDPGQWPLMNACRPHGEHAFGRLIQNGGSTIDALNSVNLGHSLGALLLNQGLLNQAEPLVRKVVDVATRELGELHVNTITSKTTLAEVLADRALFADARALLEDLLDVTRKRYGEVHPYTTLLMNNLSTVLIEQGELEGALKLQEDVIEILSQSPEPNSMGLAASFNNLANILKGQGKLREAREIQERLLGIYQKAQSSEHPDTLLAMNNLGTTLHSQGELPEARELLDKVASAQARILGGEHPNTLSAMNNLALVIADQGEFQKARELVEKVLAIRRRLLGEDHPDTLIALVNLASILFRMGDLSEALLLQERAHESFLRQLGSEHLDTLTLKINFSAMLRRRDSARARGLLSEVLEAARRTLSLNHPIAIEALYSLAVLSYEGGALTEAHELAEQSRAAAGRVRGESHPQTLASMYLLSQILAKQGAFQRARTMVKKVLDERVRSLGERHPDTTVTAWHLFLILDDLRDRKGQRSVFNHHLRWLISAPPESLRSDIRKIREELIQGLSERGEP